MAWSVLQWRWSASVFISAAWQWQPLLVNWLICRFFICMFICVSWVRHAALCAGGAENARPETDRQRKLGYGKCRTGKWRPKFGPATSNTAAADATSAKCDVCLLDPRERVVLVPCGHSRFCAQCADAVAAMPNPLCRTPIDMIMRVYCWCVSAEP